MGIGTRE